MKRTHLPALFVLAALALSGCGSSNSSTTSADKPTGSTQTQTQTSTSPAVTTQPPGGSDTTTQSTGTKTSTGATSQPSTGSKTSTEPTTIAGVPMEVRKAFLARVNTICLRSSRHLNATIKTARGAAEAYARAGEAYAEEVSQLETVTPPGPFSAGFRHFVVLLEKQGEVYPRLNTVYLVKDTASEEKLEKLGEQYSRTRRAAAERIGADGCDK